VESPYLQYLNDKYRFPRSLVHRPIQRFFARFLDEAPPGTRVLDAGCGTGVETGPYAARLGVVGIDYQREHLAWASGAWPGARFALADLARLPLPDASFDLVVLNQVIEHVLDPAAVVRELARVVAPGGRLLVSTPNYGGFGWPAIERVYHRWFVGDFDAAEFHVTHYAAASLQTELARALEVESVGTVLARLILVAAARKTNC
jgi:SAM-dependent methyltransferase